MLSVSEALARILPFFEPVGTIRLPISRVLGHALAEDIIAKTDLPLFDNSSVDGFAVRTADLSNTAPNSLKTLKVVADIPAGGFSDSAIQLGECARIMTGAPLPPGADAVVMVEDTDFHLRVAGTPAPLTVTIKNAVKPGENLRRRGDDLHARAKVLSKGTPLRAQEIGLLAMLGESVIPVYHKPKVALLSSGDELVPIQAPLSPGKIHDSNSYTLAALCAGAGMEIIQLGVHHHPTRLAGTSCPRKSKCHHFFCRCQRRRL